VQTYLIFRQLTSGKESMVHSPWSIACSSLSGYLLYYLHSKRLLILRITPWTIDYKPRTPITYVSGALFYGKYRLLLYYYFCNISVSKRPHPFFLVKNQKIVNFWC